MGHRRYGSIGREGSFRRLSIGWLAAVALLLVAFEWRSGPSVLRVVGHELELEDDYQPVPIVLQRKAPVPKPIARERLRTRLSVVVGEPVETPTPGDPEPDPGPGDPEAPAIDPRALVPPEPGDPGPMPWSGVEQRPYFRSCLDLPRVEIDACTEEGIDRHLRKNFKVPTGSRAAMFTVVTFEIDKYGAIGRIVCVPKPEDEVGEEIERVLRSMPVFMPATQNGRPVAVVYQIPFKVTRR